MNKLGIIGGSGLYNLQLGQPEKIQVTTPFGAPSSEISKYKLSNTEVYFLTRHGEGHRITPSEINYQANIYAFKKLGVESVISISAVGSMRKHIEPGHFVLPDQYIDFTKGLRKNTFFGDGVVAHAHFAHPTCDTLRGYLADVCKNLDIPVHVGGTYVCIEGPQFSTRAESELYRNWTLGPTQVDVIGMTAIPEAKLAKEAGLCYQTLAMSTDYDCWNEESGEVTVEAILKVLSNNVERSKRVVTQVVQNVLPSCTAHCKNSMKNAIVTAKEHWPKNKIEMIETLLS